MRKIQIAESPRIFEKNTKAHSLLLLVGECRRGTQKVTRRGLIFLG